MPENTDKLTSYKYMLDLAYEGNKEAFLDMLTDDIEYHYHMTSRPLIGKEWVAKFLDNYIERCRDIDLTIHRHAETDDCLFVEGHEEYTDMHTDERVAHPFMGVVEFRNGKVAKWRDYFQMKHSA